MSKWGHILSPDHPITSVSYCITIHPWRAKSQDRNTNTNGLNLNWGESSCGIWNWRCDSELMTPLFSQFIASATVDWQSHRICLFIHFSCFGNNPIKYKCFHSCSSFCCINWHISKSRPAAARDCFPETWRVLIIGTFPEGKSSCELVTITCYRNDMHVFSSCVQHAARTKQKEGLKISSIFTGSFFWSKNIDTVTEWITWLYRR